MNRMNGMRNGNEGTRDLNSCSFLFLIQSILFIPSNLFSLCFSSVRFFFVSPLSQWHGRTGQACEHT